MNIFAPSGLLNSLMPAISPYKPWIKISVTLAALIALIFAVARPWGGLKDYSTNKEGIEVVIAMDVSNSMYAPVGSDGDGSQRMRTAKLMLEKLISRLGNDRVGLIVYAGGAHTLIPVTSDYVSVKTFLKAIDPQQYSNQGTNMAAAIDAAAVSFSEKSEVGKAVVLITDAEELENIEAVKKTAENAAKNKIQLNVIGVGHATPVSIPMPNGSLLTDDSGHLVHTALNEELAASIAKAGKGLYVNASSSDALVELQKQLSTLEKSTLETNIYALHDELYSIFAAIALVLLIADIFILDRNIPWLDKFTFFKKEVKK